MKNPAVGFFLFLTAGMLSAPAYATGTITCQSATGSVVELQIGFVAVDAIIGAYIEAGGSVWSTSIGQGTQISILQSFIGDEKIMADFGDSNLENIIARLRLFRASQGQDLAMAGTLQIADVGAYAVSCKGP